MLAHATATQLNLLASCNLNGRQFTSNTIDCKENLTDLCINNPISSFVVDGRQRNTSNA